MFFKATEMYYQMAFQNDSTNSVLDYPNPKSMPGLSYNLVFNIQYTL